MYKHSANYLLNLLFGIILITVGQARSGRGGASSPSTNTRWGAMRERVSRIGDVHSHYEPLTHMGISHIWICIISVYDTVQYCCVLILVEYCDNIQVLTFPPKA